MDVKRFESLWLDTVEWNKRLWLNSRERTERPVERTERLVWRRLSSYGGWWRGHGDLIQCSAVRSY